MVAKDDVGALARRIFVIREQRVLLDTDLARVYGVTTKRLNEAVKRNRSRFPADFAFRITAAEFGVLRTPQVPDSEEFRQMWSQNATTSAARRRIGHRPWAFTEHGALMASNVLRSERAVRMGIYVIRAFISLRDSLAANTTILKRLAEIDRTLLQHDSALRDVYRKLIPLLQPPPDPPKRRIGFLSDDD